MGALIGAGIASGVGSILGAILGSSAAQKAAGVQAQAAEYGANLQNQATQQALGLQQQEWQAAQAELAPFLNLGYGAMGQLEAGMGLPSTAPSLSGVSPATPATLAPQNNASTQQAQNNGMLLSQLGLSGKETAPSLSLGVDNTSQATFQQAFESAGLDIQNAVASGVLTPQQGASAIQNLQSQLNLYGSGGYGKAQGTLGQAQSELQGYLNNILGGKAALFGAPGGKTLSQNYISNSKGWMPGALDTGISVANYAISQALQSSGGGMQAPQPAASSAPQPPSTGTDSLRQPFTSTPSGGNPIQATVGTQPPTPAGAQSAGQPTGQGVLNAPLNTTGALNATALNEQWATPFVAPSASDVANTPGYQFMVDQANQAIQRSAAAQGNLLTGGTARAIADYTTGLADTYYQQAYNNALQQYQQAYNIFQNNQTGQYNKLASLMGVGQTTAGQLSSAGSNYANSAAATGMAGANAVTNQMNNAAAATASGYIGGANVFGGLFQTMGALPLGLLALNSAMKNTNNG